MNDTEERRDRIAAYLDGTLPTRERSALERALVTDEEVAQLFGEELLLRDLLRHAPPEVPPAEVLARWEAALMGALDAEDDETPGWVTQALGGLGWTVRGPALSMSTAGAGPSLQGLSTLRYGLPSREPRPPMWRRLLSRALDRRG